MLRSNARDDDDVSPEDAAQIEEQRKAAALEAYRRNNPSWFYDLPPKARRRSGPP